MKGTFCGGVWGGAEARRGIKTENQKKCMHKSYNKPLQFFLDQKSLKFIFWGMDGGGGKPVDVQKYKCYKIRQNSI